jgi:hypothetical protein
MPVLVSDLTEACYVKSFDFDPNSADATDVGWIDGTDYDAFLFSFFRTVGTSNVDTFRVLGNTAANGGGTDVTIKTKTITAQPNLLGDNAFLHVTRDEIAVAAANAGVEVVGISLQLEFATNTDEGVAVYIFENGRRQYADQTADIIA